MTHTSKISRIKAYRVDRKKSHQTHHPVWQFAKSPLRCRNSCDIYGITKCYLLPGRGDISAFAPAKQVLDLATPDGWKAELTWVEDSVGSDTKLQFSQRISRSGERSVSAKFEGIDPENKISIKINK